MPRPATPPQRPQHQGGHQRGLRLPLQVQQGAVAAVVTLSYSSCVLPFLKYLLYPCNGVQIIPPLIVAGLQEVRGAQHALRRQELVPRRQHPHLHK